MYRGISYNRYICVSIIYIRVTVGDMLHIGYISVRSRGIAMSGVKRKEVMCARIFGE